MAAEDLTREGNNYQKRGVSVMVSEPLTGTQVQTDGCIIGTLPEKSAVIGIYLYTSVVSGDADTIDVNYNDAEIGSEIDAETTGITPDDVTVANAYSASGGDIVIKDGSQGVTTAWRGRLIIEYIELDKHTGEYTEVTQS